MSDIQFDDQDFVRPFEERQQPTLVRWVLKTGVVTTEQAANYLLIGIAIVGAILTFIILFSGDEGKPTQQFREGQSVSQPSPR